VTDPDLTAALHELGIDRESWRVLALLPLVEVAWADGSIHRRETREIEAIARQHGLLHGDGERILHGWLTLPPSHGYHVRGREILADLARRTEVIPGDGDGLATLVGFCERVARAAGGLYNVAWTVDARERMAIREIAEAFSLAEAPPDWAELAAL
jgi:hypothetical protein